MPGPTPTPVQSDPDLPQSVDVVVIGGGVIGCFSALELAERGYRVAIVEKGIIGGEQSSRNWGWVRLSQRDPREVPLMVESVKIWPDLDARLQRKTGYVRRGSIFPNEDAASRAQNEASLKDMAPYHLGSKMLTQAELAKLIPQENHLPLDGGLYTPVDGGAEPQWVAPAVAERARELGASVLTHCAVRGIETQAGKVSGVVTEKGTIACSQVLLAGGVWSTLMLASMGVRLPQLKVLNCVLRTKPFDTDIEPVFWCKQFAVRKRADEGFTIADGEVSNVIDIVPDSFRHFKAFFPTFLAMRKSLRLRFGKRYFTELGIPRHWQMTDVSPFEKCRILDPAPPQAIIDNFYTHLKTNWPVFKDSEIAQTWAGYIDATPDAVPVIDRIEKIPGLTLATGFSGHGFGISPAAGRLAADIVTEKTQPLVDPTAMRFSRFSDGSKISIGAGF